MFSKATSTSGTEAFILLEGKDDVYFGDIIQELFSRLEHTLRQNSFSLSDIVRLKIYLSDIANQQSQIRSLLKEKNLSLHYFLVGEAPASGSKIAIEAYLLKSEELTKNLISDHGIRICHGTYESLWIHKCPYQKLSHEEQSKHLFFELDDELHSLGASIANNTLRTWIYVRDIDNNYQIMCDIRSRYYAEIGLTPKTHFIASTGIEGNTEYASRIFAMDSLSIKGILPEQVHYISAKENLCATSEYRTTASYGNVGRNVTFERATQVTFGDRKHVFISGTASIDKDGQILFPKDVIKQTERVLENIQALLSKVNTTLKNMLYMIVYIRDLSDYKIVKNYLESKLPQNIPYLMVQGRICNPCWLVEIDGFAVTLEDSPQFPHFF